VSVYPFFSSVYFINTVQMQMSSIQTPAEYAGGQDCAMRVLSSHVGRAITTTDRCLSNNDIQAAAPPVP